MSDVNVVAPADAGSAQPAIPSESVHNPAADGGKILDVREAARLLASQRKKKDPAPPEVETGNPNLAQPANAAPEETPSSGETTEEA